MKLAERAKCVEQAFETIHKVLNKYAVVDEEYQELLEIDELELVYSLLEKAVED